MAKAVTIAASLELGRRRQAHLPKERRTITESTDIAHYLRSVLRDYTHEMFGVIFLNRANRITHFEIISEGGITSTVADPRVIVRKALEENAVNIILTHNHPSGNLRPSLTDMELTRRISDAANLFDIKVLDHIIVSDDGYFSFADEGVL